MRQFRRSDRLNELILRDISVLLDRELADIAPGLTTFTAVRLTGDLRYAKVYYSFLGDEQSHQRVEQYLQRQRRRIRSEIGKNLRIRHIPEIVFKYDPTVEEGIRLDQLFNEIKRDRGER
jgi:ribosome-binding factor A